MTPLTRATLHGHPAIVQLLIEQKADVRKANRDGNTALHSAAFLGRFEIVTILLKNRASTTVRNHRRESPIDVVSGEWNKPLADFYRFLNTFIANKAKLDELPQQRAEIADLLRPIGMKKNILHHLVWAVIAVTTFVVGSKTNSPDGGSSATSKQPPFSPMHDAKPRFPRPFHQKQILL